MNENAATKSRITRESFFAATGFWPEQDDLERCNCDQAGRIGHTMCGWDSARNMPNFIPSLHSVRDPT